MSLTITTKEQVHSTDVAALCAHLRSLLRRFPDRRLTMKATYEEIEVTIGPKEVDDGSTS